MDNRRRTTNSYDEIKKKNNLKDAQKNEIETIKREAFQWRDKLSLEVDDCLKKIKNILYFHHPLTLALYFSIT